MCGIPKPLPRFFSLGSQLGVGGSGSRRDDLRLPAGVRPLPLVSPVPYCAAAGQPKPPEAKP